MASAGVAPLAGITALAARDALAPTRDETVLVIGATGGVGSFFVQLAAGAGPHVIAPALPEDHDYLHRVGVSELVETALGLGLGGEGLLRRDRTAVHPLLELTLQDVLDMRQLARFISLEELPHHEQIADPGGRDGAVRGRYG